MKYVMEIPSKADFVTAYYMEDGLPVMYKSDRIDDLEPYTESDRKIIEDEVWKLADYMVRMGVYEKEKCFGFSSTTEVTTNLTYQEAKTKFEEWLKQKDEIHVGDEVTTDDALSNGFVTRVDEYEDANIVWATGGTGCFHTYLLKKTGRHFPEVAELLEKMRGEEE